MDFVGELRVWRAVGGGGGGGVGRTARPGWWFKKLKAGPLGAAAL